MRVLVRAVAAVAAFAVVQLPPARAEPRDQVIAVPGEDGEMNAAIAKARGTLSTFWKALEKPAAGVDGFALKVRITDQDHSEHFWLVDPAKEGAGYIGTINNDPNLVSNVKIGQRCAFKEADITDWMFMRNGRIVGNQTLRPLLKRMPVEQAKAYRQMLEQP